MRLQIIRAAEDGNITRGSLYINGTFYAHTIEPAKHWKKGPIPEGTYRVEVTWSPKFGKLLPIVCAVPGFSGIRIHGGSSAVHTEGCVCIPLGKVPHLTALIRNEQENQHNIDITITRAATCHNGKLFDE